jgi:cytochrome P450
MQTSVAPEDIRTFIPPHPDPAPENLSPRQFASLMRTNNIRIWSQQAYEEEVVLRRFFGRSSVLFNAPKQSAMFWSITRRPMYGRTRAALRILKPLLGEGLFTSEGPAWRHQRRSLAPAFTPRSVELLIPHTRSATTEMIGSLAATEKERVDLFPMIQRLALEIAGRAMFSLKMGQHGPELRDQITRYGQRLGRPRLLDFVVPIGIPTPHDWGRAWFRRGWIRLIDQIMAERIARASPTPGRPNCWTIYRGPSNPDPSGTSSTTSRL